MLLLSSKIEPGTRETSQGPMWAGRLRPTLAMPNVPLRAAKKNSSPCRLPCRAQAIILTPPRQTAPQGASTAADDVLDVVGSRFSKWRT